MDYYIFIYIIFGILPSLVWLFYYLTKDAHPEPKKSILKIFLWGVLITVPVFFVQVGLKTLLSVWSQRVGLGDLDGVLAQPYLNLDTLSFWFVLIYWFFVIATTEEVFKYLVIKFKITNSPDLDEPVDFMIYMVIAALGFTAVENILYLFQPASQLSLGILINKTLLVSFIRFIGATFLHTLCSALIGYYMAMSFCSPKRKKLILFGGILMAILLHGFYDFSIMTLDGYTKLVIPVVIIISLAFLVFSGFEKLKKLKSVCSLK